VLALPLAGLTHWPSRTTSVVVVVVTPPLVVTVVVPPFVVDLRVTFLILLGSCLYPDDDLIVVLLD